MTKTKERLFYFLPPLIFISNELIRSHIRPIYGQKKYGIWSEILGWLPNFLAGFGILALGIGILLFSQNISDKKMLRKTRIVALIAISIIALSGLILHEITQKDTGLYYDTQDISATVGGVLLGVVLYYFMLLRKPSNHQSTNHDEKINITRTSFWPLFL